MDKQEIIEELEKIQVHLLVFEEYQIAEYVDHTSNMLFELIDNLKKRFIFTVDNLSVILNLFFQMG